MATHPHLPVCLCSDGYSFTVFKIPTFSLPSLLSNLICFARNSVGLPLLSSCAEKAVNACLDPALLKYEHLTLRNVAASFSEDKELNDTLASTYSIGSSLAAGYMPALSGVEEGGLQFAGLGSTLEFSTSASASDIQLEDAVAYLVCAWGLVLTCGLSMPGDGISKVTIPSDSNQRNVQLNQAEMSNSTMILATSVLDVFKMLHEKKEVALEIANVKTFVNMFFSILPINSIAQSHLGTAAALANGLLVIKLTKLHQSFLPPAHVDGMEMQCFLDYVNSVSTDMSEISDLLDSMTTVIEHTYGLGPVNNTFYAPCFLKNRVENQLTSTMSALSPAFSLFLQVSQRFHRDISTREEVVKKHIASTVADGQLQDRKMSLLYRDLLECLSNALVTIQYANTQIRWISSTQVEKCDPITSNLPKQRKLKKLISMLEQYDLQGAFEYVHSLMGYKQVVTSYFIPSRLLKRVKSVVLVLCQVMTLYFCDKAPFITLSSSHVPHNLTLSRKKLLKAVQNESLSQFWTVDHTLELLVASQHWSDACSFLQKIRDWKKTFLLATVVVHHSRLMRLCTTEYIELKELSYQLIMEKILYSIGLTKSLVSTATNSSEVSRVSCLSGLSDSHLQQQNVIKFVSDCLTVCAHAKLDSVLLTSVCSVVAELTQCSRKLSLEVPSAIYLPAPPLFCPQPAVAKEVS